MISNKSQPKNTTPIIGTNCTKIKRAKESLTLNSIQVNILYFFSGDALVFFISLGKAKLMKCLTALMFFLSSALSMSQTKSLDGDSLLLKLSANLPNGWQIRILDDTLIIENLAPIWVLSSNFINAPSKDFEDNEENKTRIIENGFKTHAQFSFHLKERIAETPSKKSKGKKKREVDPNAPNYLSAKYGLYQIKAIGFDDSYTRCYPWAIADEAAKIYYTTIGLILEKIKGPG